MRDAARLAQLVRLLGTDKDGERLAAVAAMDRALRAGGHDWHDLADAVERGWQARKSEPIALRDWQSVSQTCLAQGARRLSPSELDFLRSMMMRPTEPTGRQSRWLDAICMSLGIDRRAAA
jgi:hypothetical protein